MLLLLCALCALLLVTGIGTTGAVLVLEEEEEEGLGVLTVEGFALSMLVVETGATTIVVLEEVDDGGGGAGLDVDVLLIGAGATVGVLETDTTGVLRDEVEDECELLAALLRATTVEVVL